MSESLDFGSRFAAVLESAGRPKSAPSLTESDPTEQIETDEGDEGEEKKAEKIVTKPTTINLFQHPDAHPLVLDLALLRKYGPEWLFWEPEVLEWRIPRDFRTTGISDLNMNKVQAVKTLHCVESFWKKWEVFNWCTASLNGLFPDFDILQVPTAAQCLVSADIANKVRSDVAWSEEVKTFMETVFKHGGLFCSLEPLEFIRATSDGLPIPIEEVEKRWPDVRTSKKAPTEETIVDEQLRRALDAYEYLEETRERLRTQLPVVLNV